VRRGVQGVLDAFPAVGLRRPFSVRRTAWGTDPLFRGSYSYCPAAAAAAEMDALAAPVAPSARPDPDPADPGAGAGGAALPRVLFAGEATHRQFFGTVHGAYFSVRPRPVALGASPFRARACAWPHSGFDGRGIGQLASGVFVETHQGHASVEGEALQWQSSLGSDWCACDSQADLTHRSCACASGTA